MNKIIILILVGVFLASCSIGGENRDFDEILKGYYSNGFTEEGSLVIKSQGEWEEFWIRLHEGSDPIPLLPEVNFDSEIVVAVFMGEKSSGGYEISIEKIIEKDSELVISIREVNPKLGEGVTMALTQPFHIIKTQRVDKEIRFDK